MGAINAWAMGVFCQLAPCGKILRERLCPIDEGLRREYNCKQLHIDISVEENEYMGDLVTESWRWWKANTMPTWKNISELSPEILLRVGLNGDTPLKLECNCIR